MEPEVEAVFSDEVVGEAADLFGASSDQLTLLGDHENYVYRLESNDGASIVRITHPIHRSIGEIEAEIDWVNYLRDHGVSVCGALTNRRNEGVSPVGTGESTFFVTGFEFADGRLASEQDWGPGLFWEWGRVLGKTHRTTTSYRRAAGLPRRNRFDQDPYRQNGLDWIPADQGAVRERYAATMARFEGLPAGRDVFGLVHTDLYQANFHVTETGIMIFDTDDSAYHWFIEDVSSAIYYGVHHPASPDDRVEFVQEFLGPFWAGYRTEFDLDAAWLGHLPLFLDARALLIYGMMHSKFDMENLNQEDADWLAAFREKLESGAPWWAGDSRQRHENGEPWSPLDFLAAAGV